MDEREFLDSVYALWAKTTWAENAYWMPEEVVNVPGKFKIHAVTRDPETLEEDRKLVATYLSDEDADFITALHGSFPDIYRRALEAYDEADRLDVERDEAVGRIFDLESEIQQLRAENSRLERDLEQLDLDYLSAKGEAEYWKEQADERG